MFFSFREEDKERERERKGQEKEEITLLLDLVWSLGA